MSVKSFSDPYIVLEGTESFSVGTGAFQVVGGAGIGKTLNVGVGINVGALGYGITANSIDIGDATVSARWRIANGGSNLNFLQNNGTGTYVWKHTM